MCTCVYTFPDVHIRVHPTSRKEQKYPDGYTQAHPPPDEYTRYFHPCCVHSCAPTLCYVQPSGLPKMCPSQGLAAAKENRNFPGGCEEEEDEGTKRADQARQSPWAPCPPSIRPHHGCRSGAPWLSVRLARAVGALRLVLARLDSARLDPELRRMWRRRPASRSFPGGAAGPAPSALRPRRARPAEAGTSAARARSGHRGPDGRVPRRYHHCGTDGASGCPRGVWADAGRPQSRRPVGGCALGRGRDCAFASEEV